MFASECIMILTTNEMLDKSFKDEQGETRMNPKELAKALHQLDSLYQQKDSFKNWLSGDTDARERYERIKQDIETAFPGLRVVYVGLGYKETHVLMAEGQ